MGLDPRNWMSNGSSSRVHSHIKSLDLSENPVGVVGAKDIADMLDSNITP